MPRLIRNALTVAKVRNAEPGSYVDGNGLMLRVKATGARQWIQRVTIHGRRVDLGLGSADLVTLASARQTAAANMAAARAGLDPRRPTTAPSFAEASEAVVAERMVEWAEHTRDGNAKDWRAAMSRYAFPVIGGIAVDKIGSAAIKSVLYPLALDGKHALVKATAQRISAVLDWAIVEEHRTAANPVAAVVRGLPKRKTAIRHAPALPYTEVGAALVKIDARESKTLNPAAIRAADVLKLAVRFVALTAARQIEVRRATWAEIDMQAATWTKASEKVSREQAHRVPLSEQALDLLRAARELNPESALIFPGAKDGKMIGASSIGNALKAVGCDASGHGFRTSFKGWARNHDVGEKLSEFALAHVEGSATVAAYARDDLIEKRRPVMQAWADYIAPSAPVEYLRVA